MYLQRITNPLKGLFLLNVTLLLLFFNTSIVFADFYVIAGSRGVGTKITSLPYTIASPGFYYITQDLSISNANGINITADNVTLDLMGFSLMGAGVSSGFHGVYMGGRTNVEIRNGTIRNFGASGITDLGPLARGHRIINMRILNNKLHGIGIDGSGHLIERCTVIGNENFGIWVNRACTVIGNISNNNGGIGITGDEGGCIITGNTCEFNGSHGIAAYSDSIITGNTSYNNALDGIRATNGVTITNNTCSANDGTGIHAGTASSVIGNTSRSNSDYGIYLSGYNLVDQNTSTNNTTLDMNSCTTCRFGNNIPTF